MGLFLSMSAIVGVDEEFAVIAVGGIGLEEDPPIPGTGRGKHDVHDQGVLVHIQATAVGGDAVGHHVALHGGRCRKTHYVGGAPADRCRGERRRGRCIPTIGEGGADGGAEIIAVEIPLAHDRGGRGPVESSAQDDRA